jgi:glycosyltransferase involved in cell wall biosynthesis
MDRGGIETSIMHVLRRLDRQRFSTDFLYVDSNGPSVYDDEIRAMGLPIHHCSKRDLLRFASNFRRINRTYGPFDVVHASLHRFNGYIAKVAAENSIPVRIVHSHNDTALVDGEAGWFRRLYIARQNFWIQKYATSGLAISTKAAAALYGADWQSDPRWKVYLEGRDLQEYEKLPEREAVRSELGLPNDAYVLGHIGRFREQKNHRFLFDVFQATLKRLPSARLLLVGDGPLRSELQRQIEQRHLSHAVVMAGDRSDVSRILLGAVDVFVLPSLYEGLGLVLIEAQAAGLPCICSSIVPNEAIVVEPLVKRLGLTEPIEQWVDAILTPTRFSRQQALETVMRTPFSLEHSVRALEAEYSAGSNGQF